jgi:hypothetical protein
MTGEKSPNYSRLLDDLETNIASKAHRSTKPCHMFPLKSLLKLPLKTLKYF